MHAYDKIHPTALFVNFAVIIVMTVIFMHPIALAVSFSGAVFYYCLLKKGGEKKSLIFILPIALTAALLNPLFNHRGMTVLWYFPGGNPLTAESLFYGAASGVMMASGIIWFLCLTEVFTGDKILCVVGKASPSFALIFSMALRFVPLFKEKMKSVSVAQRGLYPCRKGAFFKIKRTLYIFSASSMQCLDMALEASDSLKSRGYGTGRRSFYTPYKWNICSKVYASLSVLCPLFFAAARLMGAAEYTYFPEISFHGDTFLAAGVYLLYAVLCFMPSYIEIKEELLWRKLQSKI